MQNSIETKFSKLIERKNSELYLYRKIRKQYLAPAIIGLLLGTIIISILFPQAEKVLDSSLLEKHFAGMFVGCKKISECFSFVFQLSFSDIRHTFLIFISGFTYFCFFASATVIFVKGLIFGTAITYAILSTASAFSLNLLVFLLCKAALLCVMLELASAAYSFSYDFRAIKSKKSVLRRAPATYQYTYRFAVTLGMILFINLVYSLLIYFLAG